MRDMREFRRIAARAPRALRQLRARLMLEPLCSAMGVKDVTCPACRGGGWLDPAVLEFCPLCRGFGEVPDRLADWFRSRVSESRARRMGRRSGGAAPGLDAAGALACAARTGRLAGAAYRVHLPAGHFDG